jgi:F0F1-type ATP synthase assembly protein I
MPIRSKEEKNLAASDEDQDVTRKSGMAYAAGLTIFVSVAAFMGFGWLLDRWLGTNWIMIAGILFGAAVGLFEFVRIISKIK